MRVDDDELFESFNAFWYCWVYQSEIKSPASLPLRLRHLWRHLRHLKIDTSIRRRRRGFVEGW